VLCAVEGLLYYMPTLIRLMFETMATPQERYLDQLLFHLIYDGKEIGSCAPVAPSNAPSLPVFWRI
jgi:hypothetical protein